MQQDVKIDSAGGCNMADVVRTVAMQHLSGVKPAPRLFYYPGSDLKIVDTLLKLFSRSGAEHFVEVFGGSGTVTYNVAVRNMFKTVIYNDIDNLLTDTFATIRDMPQDVAWRLLMTPCSRRYWQRVARAIRTGEIRYWTRADRAAAVIFYHHMSLGGSANRTNSFLGTRTRRGTIVSRCGELATVAATVLEWARVWRVAIENMDFRDVIKTYDKEKTLFYLDPPFVAERGKYYRHGFEHRDMQDLLELLRNIRGKFVLKLSDRNLKYDYVREFVKKYAVETLNIKVSKKKDEGRIVLIHSLPGLDTWLT
ncbi:MAG: DNA adenine methylase [Pyrobaculum sp.]